MGSDGEVPWLSGKPEPAEQPLDAVGLGQCAQDATQAGPAPTHEDVDREHAVETGGPAQPASSLPARGVGRPRIILSWRRRHERRSPRRIRPSTA